MYQLFLSEIQRVKNSSEKRVNPLFEKNYINDLFTRIKRIFFVLILMCISVAILIIKTTLNLYDILERRIKKLHPYELPEIIAVPIKKGLTEYLNWVSENTK